MTAIVFAGPSLAGAPLPRYPDLELRPPAEAGDLYLAARGGATVIGLVDGAFEDRPTVWHKEILWALDRGVRVIGAASLGALRAAECAAFGMEGVGQIFERCRDGDLEDDHELALAYAPAELGYAALSEPLVNVRASLSAAVEAGAVRRASGIALVRRAEAIPFKELTWPKLLDEAAGLGWSAADRERLEAWLPEGRVDQKRADALLLLAAVAEAARSPQPERHATFQFASTRYWRQAVEWFERGTTPVTAEDAAVLDELRLDPARFEREMIRAYARRAAKLVPADNDVPADELVGDLRLRLGLASASDFRAWLKEVRAAPAALTETLEDEERLMVALEADRPALAPAVLNALRIEGRFEALEHRAADKHRILDGKSEPVYREAELHALIDDLCKRMRVTIDSDDLDVVARSLGLADRRALHRLLRRERDYVLLSGAGGRG